jgi:hypothetical protein
MSPRFEDSLGSPNEGSLDDDGHRASHIDLRLDMPEKDRHFRGMKRPGSRRQRYVKSIASLTRDTT